MQYQQFLRHLYSLHIGFGAVTFYPTHLDPQRIKRGRIYMYCKSENSPSQHEFLALYTFILSFSKKNQMLKYTYICYLRIRKSGLHSGQIFIYLTRDLDPSHLIRRIRFHLKMQYNFEEENLSTLLLSIGFQNKGDRL